MSRYVVNLSERLKKRLKDDELGVPFTDEMHGFRILNGRTEIWFKIPVEKVKFVHIGDMVLIYDFVNEIWFGGRIRGIDVRRIGEVSRDKTLLTELPDSLCALLEKGHTVYGPGPYVINVDLLCIIDKGVRKPVNTCPTNASVLLMPTLENDWGEPTLYDVIGLQREGISLGVVSQGQRPYEDPISKKLVTYRLNLSAMSNRHMIILGTSGVGKTIFLKHLAWQLAENGYAVTLFDLQGDIIQIIEKANLRKGKKKILGDYGVRVWSEWKWHPKAFDPTKVKIFAPRPNREEKYDKNELDLVKRWCNAKQVFFKEFSLSFYNVSVEDLLLYMPKLTELAQFALDSLFSYYRTQRRGDLGAFVQWVQNAERDRNEYVWRDERGHEIVRVHENTFGNLQRNLRWLEDLGIFDVPNAPEPTFEELVEQGKISIIYLKHIIDPSLLRVYEFRIPSIIFSKREEYIKRAIIIDEAHEVIPKKAEGIYAELAAIKFEKMARQGRKYNIDLIVSTHKPRDINPIVYGLCGTMLIFRIAREDLDLIKPPEEYETSLIKYSPGFGLIFSPENTHEPWVEIYTPPVRCMHEKPPEFFLRMKREIERARRREE